LGNVHAAFSPPDSPSRISYTQRVRFFFGLEGTTSPLSSLGNLESCSKRSFFPERVTPTLPPPFFLRAPGHTTRRSLVVTAVAAFLIPVEPKQMLSPFFVEIGVDLRTQMPRPSRVGFLSLSFCISYSAVAYRFARAHVFSRVPPRGIRWRRAGVGSLCYRSCRSRSFSWPRFR